MNSVALVLGDNIFFGSNMDEYYNPITTQREEWFFAYHVSDPEGTVVRI
jgi:glucose-1-phosphate thymidylyltransferase